MRAIWGIAFAVALIFCGVGPAGADAQLEYDADLMSALDKANRWGLDALPDFERLIASRPERPEAYAWKGWLLHNVASMEATPVDDRESLLVQAMHAFFAAVDIDRQRLLYQVGLASVLLDMKLYEKVILILDEAIGGLDEGSMRREEEAFLMGLGDYVSAITKQAHPQVFLEKVKTWTERALEVGIARDVVLDYLYLLGFIKPLSATSYFLAHQEQYGYLDVIHAIMCEGIRDGGHSAAARECYKALSQDSRTRPRLKEYGARRSEDLDWGSNLR